MNESRAPISVQVGLLLAGMALLALQVAATRLFSFMLWYHFAFLVISLAFLGFTAGGLLVARRGTAWKADPLPRLTRAALLAALGVPVMFRIAAALPLEPDFATRPAQLLLFAVLVLALLVPFFLLGLIVCLVLAAWPRDVARLYFANMLGSGLGCLVVVLLLDGLGVPATIYAAGLICFGGALAFGATLPGARTAKGRAWRLLGAIAFGVLILLARDPLHPVAYMPTTKVFPALEKEQIIERRCDSLSCVDFFDNPMHHGVWGLSKAWPEDRPKPRQIGISIDSWAITSIFKRDEVEVSDSFLGYLPPSLVHALGPFDNALVIGAGGGVDVLSALQHGAGHVTGVDINPLVVGAVKGRWADWAGGLYTDEPRVDIHVAEGRHFLKRTKQRFDLVQLSGVDTYAASQAGGFALHENYLYTVEAFHDYLDALKPGGVVTLTRWLYFPPRHTLKLVTIIQQALTERGATRPQDHLAIFSSDQYTVVVLKDEPLTRGQVQRLLDAAGERQYSPIYLPYTEVNIFAREPFNLEVNPFYAIWDDPEAFIAQYPFDIRPSTDDRPFFFEHNRWLNLLKPISRDMLFEQSSAQLILLITLLLTVVCAAIILIVARGGPQPATGGLGPPGHLYFLAIGLAYLFVENLMVQRIILYLGNPAYALSVILAGLLIFSGIGSALAPRVARRLPPPAIFAAIAVILVGYALGLRPLLEAVLGWPLIVRVMLVLILLAPPGLLMGMPFPLALERLAQTDESLVPRAWVVNGAASVTGGVIAVILAISWGFGTIFIVSAMLYALVAMLWPRLPRAAAE